MPSNNFLTIKVPFRKHFLKEHSIFFLHEEHAKKKDPFVEWKGFMELKSFSWNHRCK